MQIDILAFGITKDIVGGSSLQFELQEGSTVKDLKQQLCERYPAMNDLTSMLIAVDEEYGDETLVLTGREEVALIPPVSGG